MGGTKGISFYYTSVFLLSVRFSLPHCTTRWQFDFESQHGCYSIPRAAKYSEHCTVKQKLILSLI